MAFNHDAFVASANYKRLDASLDWYIAAIKTKLDTLHSLAQHHPDKLRALYQRDPVMRKIRKVAEGLDELATEAGVI